MELRPQFKETEIGVIPEDWDVRPFTRTLHIRSGQVDPKRDEFRNMILVAPDHLVENTGCLISRVTASDQRAKSGKYRFFAGDIVYSKIRPYLNKVMLAQFDGLCSADMYPLSALAGADGIFCFYSLLSKRFVSFASTVSVRNAIPKINREELAQFSFALPSLPEQHAISDALSDADALIAALDALIAKKRDLKEAAMQQLLTGKNRLPGFSEKWRNYSIGELFSFKNGLNKAKRFFGSGTPIVNYMDVFSNSSLTESCILGSVEVDADEMRAFSARRGDVFFTRTSETVEEIGAASVLLDEIEGAVFSGFLLRARPRGDIIADEYKKYCFCASQVRAQIVSRASYTTRALTNGRSLSMVSMLVPPMDEQEAIAGVLGDWDADLAALEAERDKVRALKQGMMQELLTGRVRLV